MGDVEFQSRVLSMLDSIRTDVTMTKERVGAVSERVARLETVQAERCTAQGKRLEALEDEQERQGQEIQQLKEHKALTKGQATALAAVGTAVGAAAGALAPHLLGAK